MVSRLWQGTLLTSLLAIAFSTPHHARETSPEYLIGHSTKVIAAAMLQDIKDGTNLVFSPFGYSSIIAMLQEGSGGETEQQIENALYISKERTRNAYKEILLSIHKKYTLNNPQFQTWFYVYKNFTVDENYKKVILENYLTEVKNVSPNELETQEVLTTESTTAVKTSQPPTVFLSEDKGNSAHEEKIIIEEAEKAYLQKNKFATKTSIGNHKDYSTDESISLSTSNHFKNNIDKNEKPEDVNLRGNSELEGAESYQSKNPEHDFKKNEPIGTITKKQEIKTNHPSIDLLETISKTGKAMQNKESIIIFNGLYFEGEWETSFVNEEKPKDFHVRENVTVQVETIRTKGKFKTGEFPYLDSTAVSVPFQGGRYSLIIVLPNKCNGLNNLISNINSTVIHEILDTMEEKDIEIEIPKFAVESTTKPELAMSKIGVKNLFNKEADLTGISNQSRLYTEEIVQLVTMTLNEEISTNNFMTATSVTSRGIKEKFDVKHPFLFFIEDNTFKVTMVAGKMLNPTVTM